MIKKFSYKGYDFEVQVKLKEKTTERSPNGVSKTPIVARCLNHDYTIETEICVPNVATNKSIVFESQVSDVINDCMRWAASQKPGWEDDVLSELGFEEENFFEDDLRFESQ